MRLRPSGPGVSRTVSRRFASAVLSAGIMLSCGRSEPPAPKPRPAAQIIRDSSVARVDASVKKDEGPRVVSRTIRGGDYMLYPNVLWNGAGAELDVFRVLEPGVEFIMRGDTTLERSERISLIRYGERKEAATFLLDADLVVRKGPQPGTAILILTYPPDGVSRKVYFEKISKKSAEGDHVFRDAHIFSREARNSLKVLRANLWGVQLEWDGKESERSWVKYGKSKTYGENLLTVTVTARYGGTPGTAALDVLYPVLDGR